MRGWKLQRHVPARRQELLVHVRTRRHVRVLVSGGIVQPVVQWVGLVLARLPRRQLQPTVHRQHRSLHAHWMQARLLPHLRRGHYVQLQLRYDDRLLDDEVISA